jgi:hypothetical protein
MSALPPIPDWASPSLQGLAYWLGSQYSFGLAANVSEGAIAWAFNTLVFAHRTQGRHLEAEVQYRHIPELNRRGSLASSRERADLVLANVVRADRGKAYGSGEVEAIIEIKHNRSRKALVWEDIDYLGEQRRKNRSIRAFLIYASINDRPEEFTDLSGASPNQRNWLTPNKETNFRIRRVCRATHRIPSQNKLAVGHYAVLVEVEPGDA